MEVQVSQAQVKYDEGFNGANRERKIDLRAVKQEFKLVDKSFYQPPH